jgi:hypothetical protein
MPTDSLSKLLSWNAAYTGLCGVVSLAGAAALTGPFGLSDPLALQAVGAFLIAVAGAMAGAAWLVKRSLLPAMLLTVGDVGYVAASVGAVLLFPLSGLGQAVTLGVAGLVLIFVALQARAIARARAV